MLQSLQKDPGKQPVSEVLPPEGKVAQRVRGRWTLLLKALLQMLIAFAILFGAVKGMNVLIASKPEVPKRPIQEKSYAVETLNLAAADHAPTINVYGETTAGREVELRSLVAGEVVEVHPDLKAGGAVKQGEVLVAIDRFDYEGAVTEAEANLAEARAGLVESEGGVKLQKGNVVRAQEQLEFAQRDLERAEELLGKGAVTERTLDDRKLIVSQRRQTLEQAQNSLALEEARVDQQKAAIKRLEWRLQNAQRQLENTILTAPFDAIVRSESAELGRLVSINDAIVSLYSSDAFEVRFTLSDNQYGRLLAETGTVVGRPVNVTWYLGNEPVIYPATVTRIGADVASNRGGVEVIARIDGKATSIPLRPGAFVEVSLADRSYAQSYRIPETAYYGDGTVFVVENSRLQPRKVTSLAIDDGWLLVTGALKDGDVLLTTRIPEAGAGLLVKDVVEAQAGANNPDAQNAGNGQ
ncbi:efflux RND transporter periplasmic adaptor subunit [Roseibium sediminicola]|uniref:HlyD family efflux transporter periplasmic adaptor subunit n=1 Tax=Roseibium sediminicola TaxID=2933272 RepID=A0ABT0GND7_9HYPH|nr:HlyD family efflux transporter periplasmic adaptor subunit [Roseibium sp. CAU 1639]MCK7610937.1 HlyD family efflux transporter periplasmic adaptor subunit [Roseibium sp. CAU 1639]